MESIQYIQIIYCVLEVLIGIAAIIGNGLILIVFYKERNIKKKTNYYIVSLAIVDIINGFLGTSISILIVYGIPKSYYYICMFNLSILSSLYTVSILCLITISLDRYWAILYPISYKRTVGMKTTYALITFSWVAGILIGFLPMFGWRSPLPYKDCRYSKNMNYDYLLFFFVSMVIIPTIILIYIYGRIYYVILKKIHRVKPTIKNRKDKDSFNVDDGSNAKITANSCRRTKSKMDVAKNLSILVLFFMISWYPINTINGLKRAYPENRISTIWIYASIILSHLNHALNPFLYALHLKGFRAGVKSLFK